MADIFSATLRKRMQQIDEPEKASTPASAASAPTGGPRFGKQFSDEDRMRQQEALAKKLRERN